MPRSIDRSIDRCRSNHDNEVLIERLKQELEEWKEKSRKLNVELDDLKGRYSALEKEHGHMMKDYNFCNRKVASCKSEQGAFNKRISVLLSEFKRRGKKEFKQSSSCS